MVVLHAVEGDMPAQDNQRRRRESLSSTCNNMSIKVSESSSWEVERVSCSFTCARILLMLVTGTLKGFDQLMNLVMDEVVEEYG